MNIWEITFKEDERQLLYLDKNNSNKNKITLKIYHEVLDCDLFTRPEINVKFMMEKDIVNLSIKHIKQLIAQGYTWL